MAARSSAALARQAPSLGAGELAQLLLAHRFHHLARGALEARLRALAALGRERGARGHLLLLRSGRHEILLAEPVRKRHLCQEKCARGPKVPAASQSHVERLACRRLDRRRAVAPALRQAVVELALLEHGIGEPNPAADHDDNEKQQERVGDPAIARGLHVSIFFPLFGLVHARMVASLCAQRNTGCSGSIMRVSLPGLTRQSIRFATFFEMMDPRVKPAGDSCGGCTTHPAMVSFTTLTSCLSVNGFARKLNCF